MSAKKNFSRWRKKHKEELETLYHLQCGRCNYCNTWVPLDLGGKEKIRRNGNHATFDHIKALREGGENKIENMQMLCYDCNQAREFVENKQQYLEVHRKLRRV